MRHSKKLRDTRIWEIYSQKVLDEDQGYSRLGWVEEVFEVSTNYLSLVRDTFPNYTLHNERHVLNVIDIMGGLLGDQISNLTCAEAELLILVACFHDIGMVYDKDEQKYHFSNTNKFDHFLQQRYPEQYGSTYDELSDDIRRDYLRMLHPFRIAEVLHKNDWKVYFTGAKKRLALEHIIVVGQAHGEDWGKTSAWASLTCQEDDDVDLLFCAMLLRIADILDFDDTRSPQILYKYVTSNKVSTCEWQKHMNSLGFAFPEKPSMNSLNYKAVCSDPNIEYALRKFLDWIDDELLTCISLQRNCGKVWQRNFMFPRSVRRDKIISDGYESGDFRLTMDQERILELLIGENLYEKQTVFIRELLRNAVDATLLRSEIDSSFDPESDDARIDIWEWYDESGKLWYRIDDRGTGMTQGMIERYFLKIGNSYYNSKELKQDLLEHKQSKTYYSISRFGLGFLSCFLCGSQAEIATCYIDENKNKRELNMVEKDYIDGFAVNLSVTGLDGCYIIKNQAKGHVVDNPLPKPGTFSTKILETNGYRKKAGTSIAIQINPDRLGNEDLLKETERYICGTKMPIYYNGTRIGMTYREFMEQIHMVKGNTVYELSQLEKEKFDKAFPFCRGKYPTLEINVIPLDSKEYSVLPNLSGALVTTNLRGLGPAKHCWKVRGETYFLEDYNFTFSNQVRVHLRIRNARGRVKKKWSDMVRQYGSETMQALQECFCKYNSCPSTPEKLGEAWGALKNESLTDIWQVWVDAQQESECEISYQTLPIIQVFAGKGREETFRWMYRGIKVADSIIRRGLPKNGTIFLLDERWRPRVDIGRSTIRELPIDAVLAIETIIYNEKLRKPYQKKAEKNVISCMINWYKISLAEWRNVRELEIAQWMEQTGNDYAEKCKSELSTPMYTYRQQMNLSGEDKETGFGLNKYWQAFFQDYYKMTVDYQNGQIIRFSEKTECDIDSFIFDMFPPMMFCYAENVQDKQYLCSKTAISRRAITANHWFAKWLITNGTKLKKHYPQQFSQIIDLLLTGTMNNIILGVNGIRTQLLSFVAYGNTIRHIDFNGWEELDESDFWNDSEWLKTVLPKE